MAKKDNTLKRIGIFYDGNYFLHVSNFYNYSYPTRSRLDITGISKFIRQKISELETAEYHHCVVVDSHYFRGRLSAYEVSQNGNQLYYERIFDDILMSEGIITHYLPMRQRWGRREEKGIDVWLALEAYELTIHKEFDIVVLIAGDGDYIPLVRKLNTLGTRVMVMSWDFEYTDQEDRVISTRSSRDLLAEASYPLHMHEIIEKWYEESNDWLDTLFVKKDRHYDYTESSTDYEKLYSQDDDYQPVDLVDDEGNSYEEDDYNRSNSTQNSYVAGSGEAQTGTIFSLKTGFGFISYPPHNLFFHHSSLENGDFSTIKEGDLVEFTVEQTDRGDVARKVRIIQSVDV